MVDKIQKERIKKKNDWSSTKYFFVVGKPIAEKQSNIDTTGKDLRDLYNIFQEIGLPDASDQLS